MKYDHKVKFGGVLYLAEEEVPNDEKEEQIMPFAFHLPAELPYM